MGPFVSNSWTSFGVEKTVQAIGPNRGEILKYVRESQEHGKTTSSR
jgi:DNA-directed RNA polymerase subunit H (RpoH/RPB5)